MQSIIQVKEGTTRHPIHRMKNPINLELRDNEHIAIVGPNGGGKTELINTLIGKYPLLMNEVIYNFAPRESHMACDNIKYIAFRDTYGDTEGNYYYQQRWNSQETDQYPTVRELLPQTEDKKLQSKLFSLFRIEQLLNTRIIMLSSGELRKFQLTKTLLTNPRVLIMDNPFIGLDAQTRDLLRNLLAELIKISDLQIVLVLSKSDDIPSFITHVITVKDRICSEKMSIKAYTDKKNSYPEEVLSAEKRLSIINLPTHTSNFHSEHIIDFNNVCIRYGERTILKNLNWTVRKGEKWALSGENGAGKSTLLSLVCADNPQSYACDISLFGRKRGSGESIWEIKKHIGYVSPEMHRAYLKNLPAIEIVASGLHDSIGLYKRTQKDYMNICEWWMNIFGIAHLKDCNFLHLSSGEQRLALLARAFVKDPQLLILDEPLHGLDLYNRKLVKEIIETFCTRPDKTLIIVTHYQEELPKGITNHLYLKKNNK